MAATTRSRKKVQPEQRLPNEVTIAIGKNLRRFRLAAALTQEQLAYNAEVERSRISKLESGLVNPSVHTLATICHCLGVTFPMLFKGVTATIAPLAQGGPRRRANQATLEGRETVRKANR